MDEKSKTGKYDIIVIGSGISGGILSLILAKAGLKVLVLEKDEHPKFAVGESTIPQTSLNLAFMAERFEIPELRHLAHFEDVLAHVSKKCGIKRGFNYIYHRLGEAQNPDQQNQTILTPELHLYRQDIDAYVLHLAVSRGADVMQKTEVKAVEVDDRGVHIATNRAQLEASYVVDCAGPGSPLAKMFHLRDEPTRCKSNVRSLFTHMVNVTHYHQVKPFQTVPSPLGEGTLHHIFNGGWIWVIPFNNYPGAGNPLCSVGIQFDEQVPPNGMSPGDEFWSWVGKMPDVAKQFEAAKPVMEWRSVGRLQYSSKRTTGKRFCLLGHAAGFIDPLYSRGLANTTEAINALAPILIDAVKEDDFSEEKFQYLETLQRNQLDRNDQMVKCSYISWRNYELWNAWFRMWAVAVMQGGLNLKTMLANYRKTRDLQYFPASMSPTGFFGGNPDANPVHGRYRQFFDQMVQQMHAVEKGEKDASAVAESIYSGLREGNFVDDKFEIWNESRRYVKLSIP